MSRKPINDLVRIRKIVNWLLKRYPPENCKRKRCWRCRFQWMESGGEKPLDYPPGYKGNRCFCGSYLSAQIVFDD